VTFLEPQLFWTMTAGIVLIFSGIFCLKRRSRLLGRFSIPEQNSANSLPIASLIFRSLSVVLMALALAWPQWDDKEASTFSKGIDLVFVVDTSRSMLAIEDGKSRLERAVDEIGGIVSEAEGDRLSLVAFSGTAKLVCPLTNDLAGFRSFLNKLNIFTVPRGGSCLNEGIKVAVKTLQNRMDAKGLNGSSRPGAIVLISDGEDLASDASPNDSAASALSSGITVSSLMIGSPSGAKIPTSDGSGFFKDNGVEVISRPDLKVMSGIAKAGGGSFATTWKTAFPLDRIYGEDLLAVRTIDPREEGATRNTPAFQLFVLAAILIIVLELFSPYLLRHRPKRAIASALLLITAPLLISAEDSGGDLAQNGANSFKQGDYHGALASFEKAALLLKDDGSIQANLGLTYFKLDRPDKASEHLIKALDLDLDEKARKSVRFTSGIVYYRLAQKEHERAGLVQEKKVQEKMKILARAMTYLDRARSYFSDSYSSNCWKKESLINLALSKRLADRVAIDIKKAKEDLTGPYGTDSGGGGDSSAGDTDPDDVGTKEKTDVEKKPGDSGSEDPKVQRDDDKLTDEHRRPLLKEERDRIFVLLKEMERKRGALIKARNEAEREKAEIKDW